ncbi:hypothetical protein [Nocardia pseudobrasiliensis]|uniref:Excreted virulence factor EspC (Type VII ESX diderm) n=1 Tax=Nocardia pseudobrasiliensis TaxID=45979 RepID=A0A370ID28_9NOCA|nr:hypothetical protein [Nocardia pseudobrasiliensis]RDI68618.1 hypothetical protein DFR76_101153 [Nocardia pseudobrasiliensis]
MAGYLKVDIDALAKAVQLLRGSEQVLTDAMKAMAQGGHGDIGTTVLNDAAESFQRRWHFGVQRISEATKSTADGIAQCHDAYQQVDDQFAQLIAQAQAGENNPTPPAETKV